MIGKDMDENFSWDAGNILLENRIFLKACFFGHRITFFFLSNNNLIRCKNRWDSRLDSFDRFLNKLEKFQRRNIRGDNGTIFFLALCIQLVVVGALCWTPRFGTRIDMILLECKKSTLCDLIIPVVDPKQLHIRVFNRLEKFQGRTSI